MMAILTPVNCRLEGYSKHGIGGQTAGVFSQFPSRCFSPTMLFLFTSFFCTWIFKLEMSQSRKEEASRGRVQSFKQRKGSAICLPPTTFNFFNVLKLHQFTAIYSECPWVVHVTQRVLKAILKILKRHLGISNTVM